MTDIFVMTSTGMRSLVTGDIVLFDEPLGLVPAADLTPSASLTPEGN